MSRGAPPPNVVHVVPDKMGGVLSNVNLLVERLPRRTFSHHLVLVHHSLSKDTRSEGTTSSDTRAIEHRLPLENLYTVLRRLARKVPSGDGVLVANDWLELAMVSYRPSTRAVFQVLHGDFDYYYDLARKHEPVVDVFIACSELVARKLSSLLPGRANCIHHIPYGVGVPGSHRGAARGPLRLLFAGRLDQAQKRIFDLPRIDDLLRERRVDARWTVVGGGPDAETLRELWSRSDRVQWLGPRSNAETLSIMAEHDVFLLPSRAEGLPVSLLEAMSVGLVPVVSDLESGVREVVANGETGYRVPVGDIAAFAAIVAGLDSDRAQLERLGAASRRLIEERFSIDRQVARYEELFSNWRDLRRPSTPRSPLPYGSRLDKPWIPNFVVRYLRQWTRSDLLP